MIDKFENNNNNNNNVFITITNANSLNDKTKLVNLDNYWVLYGIN